MAGRAAIPRIRLGGMVRRSPIVRAVTRITIRQSRMVHGPMGERNKIRVALIALMGITAGHMVRSAPVITGVAGITRRTGVVGNDGSLPRTGGVAKPTLMRKIVGRVPGSPGVIVRMTGIAIGGGGKAGVGARVRPRSWPMAQLALSTDPRGPMPRRGRITVRVTPITFWGETRVDTDGGPAVTGFTGHRQVNSRQRKPCSSVIRQNAFRTPHEIPIVMTVGAPVPQLPSVGIHMTSPTAPRRVGPHGALIVVAPHAMGHPMGTFQRGAGFFLVIKRKFFRQDVPPLGNMAHLTLGRKGFVRHHGPPIFLPLHVLLSGFGREANPDQEKHRWKKKRPTQVRKHGNLHTYGEWV